MVQTVALIVAAGRGERAGMGIPKQYRTLAGKTALRWALERFQSHPQIAAVRVVIGAEDGERYRAAAAGLDLDAPVIGGATRQESVRNGLEALAPSGPQ